MKAYVNKYKYLAYSIDTISTYVDTTVFDPNDNNFDSKWRCVFTNNTWRPAKASGYLQPFNDKTECIQFLFTEITNQTISTFQIDDPCINPATPECQELQLLVS